MSVMWRAAVIGRWTARIAGTLMALFFLAFFVGEGFPNIFRLHWRESLSVLAMSAAVVGLAVVVLILLCANEMFGMPPLMTPALHPPPELVGTWEASLPTMDAVFTINPDASVSGRIGDAAVVNGRVVYDRSWFGTLMNWRTDYLIMGRLSRGGRFTAPLTLRGVGLEGALFLSQRPLGLKLRKP
jgi:hypothetical protein